MIYFLVVFFFLCSPSFGEESSQVLYSQDGLTFTPNEDGTGPRFYLMILKDQMILKDVRKVNLKTMMVSVDLKKEKLFTTMADEVMAWDEVD